MTKGCSSFDCVLAINYGGRDELLRAIKALISDLILKNIPLSDIDEALFSSYLDTKGLDDPDLIIRTSGEMRISNFLLWQSAYSELYIDETHWPDFTPQHLLKALLAYQNRERRKGGGTV
jgi:undecaprenyl diphosphate synthase